MTKYGDHPAGSKLAAHLTAVDRVLAWAESLPADLGMPEAEYLGASEEPELDDEQEIPPYDTRGGL